VFFSGALGQRDVPLLDVDYTGLNRGTVTVDIVTEGFAQLPSSSTLSDMLTGRSTHRRPSPVSPPRSTPPAASTRAATTNFDYILEYENAKGYLVRETL
jgi:hypothetical protein